MVERWNIGIQKDINYLNFIVNPPGGGTINPTLHCPLRAVGSTEATIPLFHHAPPPADDRSELTCSLGHPALEDIL
jgi:hypothetical protein